jgi:PAS domain-containing protein
VRADDLLTPAAAALRAHGAGLALQPAGVTATLTVPLRGYRRALGTLVFEGVRIDPGEDLALLTRADALGRRLASAIETTQLLGALARSRRDLEGLFDAVPILLLVLDDSGAIVRANRAFAEAAQLEPAATAGTRLTGLISSDLDEWLRAAVHAPGDIQPRVFDEPRLGGRFTIAVHLIVQEGGRTLRVVSGQRLAAA